MWREDGHKTVYVFVTIKKMHFVNENDILDDDDDRQAAGQTKGRQIKIWTKRDLTSIHSASLVELNFQYPWQQGVDIWRVPKF